MSRMYYRTSEHDRDLEPKDCPVEKELLPGDVCWGCLTAGIISDKRDDAKKEVSP